MLLAFTESKMGSTLSLPASSSSLSSKKVDVSTSSSSLRHRSDTAGWSSSPPVNLARRTAGERCAGDGNERSLCGDRSNAPLGVISYSRRRPSSTLLWAWARSRDSSKYTTRFCSRVSLFWSRSMIRLSSADSGVVWIVLARPPMVRRLTSKSASREATCCWSAARSCSSASLSRNASSRSCCSRALSASSLVFRAINCSTSADSRSLSSRQASLSSS
mmetsp:Transcript_63989/g.105645  ORF Transcript_63989/g.105645 Transcript_63989/m.105645 type:complete len:218 (+) Transcript_63989:147-800(+)